MVKKAKARTRKRKPENYMVDQQGNPITLAQMDAAMKYTPAPILTLCGQLEDSIMLLETRISNAIAKINSLM